MAKSPILPGWLFPIPGLFLQMFGLFSADLQLSLVGSALLVAGLGLCIRGKGYSPAWGLWGVVPLVGLIIVLAQPDRRTSPSARMRGGAGLLAIMAVLGLAFTVASPGIVSSLSLRPAPEPPATPPAVTVQQVQVDPEPKPTPLTPPPVRLRTAPLAPPTSFEEGYRQVRVGMTYEQVCELVGDDIFVVGQSDNTRIVRWRGGNRQAFNARFKEDKVDLLSSLQRVASPLPAAAAKESGERPRNIIEMWPKPEPPPEEPQEKLPAEEAPAAPDQPAVEEQPAPVPEEQAPPPRTGVVTGRAKSERVVRIGGKDAQRKSRPSLRKARLPRSSGQINRGANDVIFVNRSENAMRVGVRLGMRGKDFDLPPGGHHTLFLSNGVYSVYYIDQAEPETLYSAGQVTVDSPPTAIEVPLPK